MHFAITPEEKDGFKGKGEVYIYEYKYDGTHGTVARDRLNKYINNADDILKFFHG